MQIDPIQGYYVKFCATVDESTFMALSKWSHNAGLSIDAATEMIILTFISKREGDE